MVHKASIDHHHPSLSTVAAHTFFQDCQPSFFLSILTVHLQVGLSLPHSSNSAGIQVVLNLCHKKINYFCSQVIPRSEGLFTVTVHDLCLDSTGPASVHVQVSDVYGVDIAVVNKVGDIGRCTA